MVDTQESPEEYPGDDGKPGWARRFQAKLDAVEKPKKVTREDVLNKWDDTYDRRTELAKSARQPSTISKIVTGACLVGALWMGLSTSSGGSSFDSSSARNQSQIVSLQGDLTKVQNVQEKLPSKEAGASLVVDAYKKARGVADIQNKMIDRSKHPDADKMAMLSKSLMPFMSQPVYSATSQWYYIDPAKSNKYHDTNYEWTAETPYEFDDGGTNIRVTWLCRDTKSKVVLAWAQGDYSSTSKTFEGLAWGATLEGTNRVGTPIDTNSPDAGATSSTSASATPSSSSSKAKS